MDQPQGWQTNRRGHMADLAFLAFPQFDLYLGSGTMGSHRLGAREQPRLRKAASLRGQCNKIFQWNPTLDLSKLLRSRIAFHYYPIGLFVFMDTRHLC
jgi:hypothetical protein